MNTQAIELLVHFYCWIAFTGFADDYRRNTRHSLMRRNIAQHHAAGTDFCVRADFDPTQNFRARAYQHTGANDRMPCARVLAGSAERDLVKNRYVVFNDRGFTNHKRSRMIEQDPATNGRSWMNVRGKHLGGNALQIERQPAAAVFPKLVTHPIGAQRHEAFEKQQRL